MDENGAPLTGANVAVFDTSVTHVITGASTDGKGHFDISVEPGRYVLKITFLSYKAHQQSVKVESGEDKSLGTIHLQPSSQALGQLVVRGEQSQMTMDFDKRVFHVGKDITSMGGSAINVLRNVPSLSVDINGNISLRGDNSVRILINGHPSHMVQNGIQALRSIPSNMIKKVEVITNPSSKYSAEGTGGIINIILIKDRRLGFNGSAAVKTGYPQNYGLSTNLNYQVGNINWFANAGLGYRKNPRKGDSFQRFTGPDTTYMYGSNTNTDDKRFNSNLRLGMDYYISKKQTFTASTFLRFDRGNNSTDIHYTDLGYSPDATNSMGSDILGKSLRDNEEDRHSNDYNFNLRYENKMNGDRKKLTASARFSLRREPSNSSIKESVLEGSSTHGEGSPIHQRTEEQENRKNYRLDVKYKQPLGENGKLETGLRSRIDWNNNSQSVEELNNGIWMPITGYNGNFQYRESINGVYVILGYNWGGFSGEAGVRAGNLNIHTETKSTNQVNNKNYTNLFPSLFLNYAFNHKNSLQLSYTRRFRQPWPRMLIPFSDYTNSRSQRVGNPDLNLAFSNSYEGGYLRSWKGGSLLTSLYYRHRTGVIERITKQRQGILIHFPINLATEKSWGVEFSAKQRLFSGLSLHANMNFYRSDRNGQYQDQTFKSEAQSMRARMRLRWDFSNSWHYQAAFRYRGPHETTQGRNNGIKTMDTGISHDLWSGKARVSLNIRDLFNSQNFYNIQTTNGRPNTDFYSLRNYRWSSRAYSINFRYFFSNR